MNEGGADVSAVDHFLSGPNFRAAALSFAEAWARWLPEQPPWDWVPISGGLAADQVSVPRGCS